MAAASCGKFTLAWGEHSKWGLNWRHNFSIGRACPRKTEGDCKQLMPQAARHARAGQLAEGCCGSPDQACRSRRTFLLILPTLVFGAMSEVLPKPAGAWTTISARSRNGASPEAPLAQEQVARRPRRGGLENELGGAAGGHRSHSSHPKGPCSARRFCAPCRWYRLPRRACRAGSP